MSSAVEPHQAAHDAFNRRDWAQMRAAWSPDMVYVDHARGVTIHGIDDFIAWCQDWIAEFFDARIDDAQYLDADGHSVCRFRGRGVNDGAIGAATATGKPARPADVRGAPRRRWPADQRRDVLRRDVDDGPARRRRACRGLRPRAIRPGHMSPSPIDIVRAWTAAATAFDADALYCRRGLRVGRDAARERARPRRAAGIGRAAGLRVAMHVDAVPCADRGDAVVARSRVEWGDVDIGELVETEHGAVAFVIRDGDVARLSGTPRSDRVPLRRRAQRSRCVGPAGRHEMEIRRVLLALMVAVTWMVAAPAASAHIKRTSYWLDPAADASFSPPAGGAVPVARSLGSSLRRTQPGRDVHATHPEPAHRRASP